MTKQTTQMRIEDLLGLPIICADGTRLGHLQDLKLTPHAPYTVTHLLYGRYGVLRRLHIADLFSSMTGLPLKKQHEELEWELVERIEKDAIIVRDTSKQK